MNKNVCLDKPHRKEQKSHLDWWSGRERSVEFVICPDVGCDASSGCERSLKEMTSVWVSLWNDLILTEVRNPRGDNSVISPWAEMFQCDGLLCWTSIKETCGYFSGGAGTARMLCGSTLLERDKCLLMGNEERNLSCDCLLMVVQMFSCCRKSVPLRSRCSLT